MGFVGFFGGPLSGQLDGGVGVAMVHGCGRVLARRDSDPRREGWALSAWGGAVLIWYIGQHSARVRGGHVAVWCSCVQQGWCCVYFGVESVLPSNGNVLRQIFYL